MNAVKLSDVICITNMLPIIVSDVNAPKICLGKVIFLELIIAISLNFYSFISSPECSFSTEMM